MYAIRSYYVFVNFKLKVLEAENRGMDTTTSFVNELKTYRDQLAEPYMTDREIDEELMKMAYERITHEVSASHILIRFQEGNPDTTAAYNKIMAILARIKKGENFEKLASETVITSYSIHYTKLYEFRKKERIIYRSILCTANGRFFMAQESFPNFWM